MRIHFKLSLFKLVVLVIWNTSHLICVKPRFPAAIHKLCTGKAKIGNKTVKILIDLNKRKSNSKAWPDPPPFSVT